MRMLLVTAGSRGDVEPFAVLARRIQGAGHAVRLALPDNSGVDVTGLDVTALGVDYSTLIQQQGVSFAAVLRSYRTVVRPAMHEVLIGSVRAALDYAPDVLVAHPKILSAPLIADGLGIPFVWVEMVPAVTPTAEFPAAGTVTRNLGPFNRLTYGAAAGGAAMFRQDLKEAARLVGAQGAAPRASATLMPISPAILQRPADWPPTVHLTGPWRGGAPEPVPREVSDFIAEGDFVYAGFGSMVAGDPVARAREVIRGIRATGARALVATGLGGLSVPSDVTGTDALVTRSVAHDVVLPRAAAAVHHGGIGTVQAATAAGTVSVVVPFIADQPFWGSRLNARGLGPAPIRRRALTSARLAAALSRVDQYRPAVRDAARSMAAEDGPAAALAVLETVGR
ncbi:glycosyltransferase [Arthrobacter agilis]|uniref:glycosyltransferase n=1 Tax=Arthrobacter agilis TaxID=37921 RepID=UPI00277DFDB3|nr:glycosyltransferase [Arthrobacter agilis]MDQ0736372.1 sterol 3beta-glucosyltransferase [Arthrobacter agilis]